MEWGSCHILMEWGGSCYIAPMHEVTPSVVAMAVRIEMTI